MSADGSYGSARRELRLSPEEFALFNPAFIALLNVRVIQGWVKETNEDGAPLVMAYLAVLMTLHAPTSQLAPMRITSNFFDWVQSNPEIPASFPRSARALTPLVRSGLLFSLSGGICELRLPGILIAAPNATTKSIKGETVDIVQSQKVAHFFGRWLSRSGGAASIYSLLGVRP